jgi:hypothetical protein
MRREPLPKPAVVWRAGANRRCGTLRRSRDDEGHDRLLLRLWLLMPNSRTLPAGQEVLWRAIEAAPCAAASAKAVSLYAAQRADRNGQQPVQWLAHGRRMARPIG